MTDNTNPTKIVAEAVREYVGDGDGADEEVLAAYEQQIRAEALEDMARFANRVYSNSLVPRTLILRDLRERAAKLRGSDDD